MDINVPSKKLLSRTTLLKTVEDLSRSLDPCRSRLLRKYLAIVRGRPSSIAVLLMIELCKEAGVPLPRNLTDLYRDADEGTVLEVRRVARRIMSLCGDK